MASPWVNPREKDYWAEKSFPHEPGWYEHKSRSRLGGGQDGSPALRFYVPTALERIDRFFTYLATGGIQKIGNLVVSQLAQVAKGAVAARYRELAAGQVRSPIGKLSFRMGKDVGAENPARLPRSEVSGYTQLANAVRVKALGGNRHLVHIDGGQTHMDAKKRWPQGVPLPLLAWWIENSTPTLMPVTTRMAAYLRMLREGRGGYKGGTGRHIPNRPTGKYIVVVRPDRPVWRWVIARLTSKGMQMETTDYVARRIAIVRAQYKL